MRMHATGTSSAVGSITDFGTAYTAATLFGGNGYGQINAYKSDGTSTGYFTISTLNAGFALTGYTSAGTLTTSSTGVVSTSSDARIKSNISYISSNVTSCIMALKPATFTLNSDPTTVRLGFIAQDVETVIPEAVDGKKYEYEWETVIGPDGYRIPKLDDNGNYIYNNEIRPRGLDDRALIATLVKAFQEQSSALKETNDRLETAQNDIDMLEARLGDLEATVRSLLPPKEPDPSGPRSAALLDLASA
jgi:hypothetical protein